MTPQPDAQTGALQWGAGGASIRINKGEQNIMKTPRHSCRKQSESGIALLIAIFALMLISAVAISLIVASGTESSLAGNYRSSTSAYYAGFAGLEEARGRVVPSNPNYFDPAAGAPFLPVGTLRYIVNPAP